jgi:hypothetical protein
MNVRFRLALSASALCAILAVPAAAQAVPGDRGISDPVPGSFRLNDDTLEPGCFVPGRFAPADVDSHLVIGVDGLSEEAHVSVSNGASFSVDQVLVPSPIDGYRVVNTFDTGTVNNDADIDPNQTATLLKSPSQFVSQNDIIVCVSGHGDAAQNEPYQQEDGGLVSAKNRPIIAPKVTALGASAIDPLNTYKLGFGYDTERWYSKPSFLNAEDNPLGIPSVTDPNAFPSPTYGDNLPGFVGMLPRPADFPYDAQRVNDVDAAGEPWFFPTPAHGQNFLFKQGGDDTAWIDDGGVPGPGQSLLTVLTRGDFPISWTLRPSLGAPDTERSVEFSNADFDAWEQGWQDYYCGKGPHPDLPLAPGSNSPDPRDCPVVINPPESMPQPTPVVNVTTPAPVVNTTVVQAKCVSNRVIRMKFGKKVRRASARMNGKLYRAHRSGGVLRAKVSLKGMSAAPGQYVAIKVKTKKRGHKAVTRTRLYKICG